MAFFEKKQLKSTDDKTSEIILAMILLPNADSYSYDTLKKEIQKSYLMYDDDGNDIAAAFCIDDKQVQLAVMNFPVPYGDIEGTAQYAYNWEEALTDLKNHGAHIIIAISSKLKTTIDTFKLQTRLVSAILNVTDAIGVYIGEQSLLIRKIDYLSEATSIDDEDLPLNLWIYFGVRINKDTNSGYTYGLKAFDKVELEVLNSNKSVWEIRQFLYDIAHYVLLGDIKFQDGQTIGHSADQKIKISYSKGKYVTGNSFKLAY
jgi:hypothetical protein